MTYATPQKDIQKETPFALSTGLTCLSVPITLQHVTLRGTIPRGALEVAASEGMVISWKKYTKRCSIYPYLYLIFGGFRNESFCFNWGIVKKTSLVGCVYTPMMIEKHIYPPIINIIVGWKFLFLVDYWGYLPWLKGNLQRVESYPAFTGIVVSIHEFSILSFTNQVSSTMLIWQKCREDSVTFRQAILNGNFTTAHLDDHGMGLLT